jgi:esterase/lipase
MEPFPRKRSAWPVVLAVVVIVLSAIIFPWSASSTASRPSPVATYAEAAERVVSMRADEQPRLNPACLVKLMTHERRVDHVIVLVHGYTSCPQQFEVLGRQFFDQGYNVLIAPLPHHGLSDRMTSDQALLTAAELARYGDEVVDIARGLGEHVTVAGISAGGVVSGSAAQNRQDVDLAVLISPAFGFKQVPTPLTGAAMNLFSLLPNSFTWWDPLHKDVGGIPYAYPRYSTRALSQIMRLGYSVQNAARRSAPAARQILIVTNGNEPSVNNELTQQVGELWRAHSAAISFYEFPADWGLAHDLIDPLQPDAKTDSVYPILVDLITQSATTSSP